MNTYQKKYAVAKAMVETLESEENKIETEYIKMNNIKNSDGTKPHHIWMIDDEKTFDKANNDTAEKIDALGGSEARKNLRIAEDELINFGLTLCPESAMQPIRNTCFGLNGNYVHAEIREKMIDLTFRLNTNTVK